MDSSTKRSPLKAPPLRQAGQSLNDQIDKLLSEGLATYVFGAGFAVVVAGVEWARWYTGSPPNPLLFTILAVAALVFATWKVVGIRRKARLLRQARDGERAIGQFLEQLREQGSQIFHDLPGNGFNVDHVIVGLKGIFTVETKTFSKPARGGAKITFDGEQVLVGGFKPDRDCVVQARAQARWLRDLIAESTGRKVSVKPVVVYPGWFVDGPPSGVKSDVWILNPKALPAFIERERGSLTPQDVKLISYHISRHVRAEDSA